MLKPAQKYAFTLSIAALLLFYLAYFHHQKMKSNQLNHAVIMSTINPDLNIDKKNRASEFISTADIIIEYKTALIMYGLSALLALISLVFALKDRQEKVGARYSLLLVFLPLGIILTIIANAYRTGLFSF